MATHKKSSRSVAITTLLALLLAAVINPITSTKVQAASLGDSCLPPGTPGGIYYYVVSLNPEICEFATNNLNPFQVPTGVTSIDVLVVGGGGGGANMPFTLVNNNRIDYPIYSGGGGGGAVSICKNIPVTPGESLTRTQGAGGSRGYVAIDFPLSESNPNALGADGQDGATSSLSRASNSLCSAAGGKGGRGGGGTEATRGHGGASGSAKAGGNAAFVSTSSVNTVVGITWASSGGGGAAGDGQPGTVSAGVYKGGSGGPGISPGTLADDAGLFLNDTNLYGTGGPGGGAQELLPAPGADVAGQVDGRATAISYMNNSPVPAPGAGGRGVLGAQRDSADAGIKGVVVIRYLKPSSSPTVRNLTVASAGTGTGTVSLGSTTKNDGETFTTVATPNAGSVFAGWTCTPSSYNTSNSTLTFTVSENVSCTATFNLSSGGSDPEDPGPQGPNSGESTDSLTPPVVEPLSTSEDSDSNQAAIEPSKEFILQGSGLDKVLKVNVGSKNAVITSKTATSLGFRIPKNLSAGVYDLSLYGNFGSMTEAKFFRVHKKRIVRISAGFAGDSPVMTKYIDGTIVKFLERLPGHVSLICIGSTRNDVKTRFDVELATNRANRACSYAKSLSPNLKTEIKIKPSQGLDIRKRNVKLVLMNY